MNNLDRKTVDGFGSEWQSFNQSNTALDAATRQELFDNYFKIFPWHKLPENAVGLDFGCGSGRWAALVAPRVGRLHVADASAAALGVAKRNLSALKNVEFHHSTSSTLPIFDDSLDFAFSLGVLHHVPDTQSAISEIVAKLKPGAPFLVYLYYSFDNRPAWFKYIWLLSDALRFVISRLPHRLKIFITTILAAAVYWPLAATTRILKRIGLPSSSLPLAFYNGKPFYVMRTDAYDRFATRLEHRFSKLEIASMMKNAGLIDIVFSDTEPYWCAVGVRAKP